MEFTVREDYCITEKKEDLKNFQTFVKTRYLFRFVESFFNSVSFNMVFSLDNLEL